jgi:hypothetical protein
MSRVTKNKIIMKINQILNWATIALAAIGVFFKFMHFPGGSLLVLITMALLFITALLSFMENKVNGLDDAFNFTIVAMLLILIIGGTVNIFHWPGGEYFRNIGVVIFCLMPILTMIANTKNKISNSYWVSFLTFVFVVISIMSI